MGLNSFYDVCILIYIFLTPIRPAGLIGRPTFEKKNFKNRKISFKM